MQPLTAAAAGRAAGALLLGVLVGTVGTVVHRAYQPWGMVGALLLVLSAAVTARAWSGWVTWVGFLGGLFLAVQVLAQRGPGGDVLVPAGVLGLVWVFGSLVVTVAVALLPRRLFADGP